MSQPRLSAARKRRLAESINAEALAKVQRIESGIPLSSSPPQSSPRSSSPLDGHAQVPAIVSTPPAGSDEPDPAIGNFEIEYDYGGGDEDNVEEEEEQEEEPEDRVESAEEDEQVDDEGEELPAEVDLGEMEEATVDLTLEALEELMAQELGEKLARVLRPRRE